MHRGKEPILSPVLFPRIQAQQTSIFKECAVVMKDLRALFPWLKFPRNPLPIARLLLFSGFSWDLKCSLTVLQ